MIRRAFYSRFLSADVSKITKALEASGAPRNRAVASRVAAATEYAERLLRSFPESDRGKASVLLSIGPTRARQSHLRAGARDWADPDWAFASLLETWLTARAQVLTYKHSTLIADRIQSWIERALTPAEIQYAYDDFQWPFVDHPHLRSTIAELLGRPGQT